MIYSRFLQTLKDNGVPTEVAEKAALIFMHEHHDPSRQRSKEEQQIISNAWGYLVPKDVAGVANS